MWAPVRQLSPADRAMSATPVPKREGDRKEDTENQFPPRVEFDNYKASYFFM
jgi:hypothetical protein